MQSEGLTGRITELDMSFNAKDLAFLNSFRRDFDTDFLRVIHDDKFCPTDLYAKKIASKVLLGGKRIRPILVYLASTLSGFKDIKKIRRLGFVIELIHIASLMHDDVMDKSNIRRGRQTINSSDGNSISILAGDYLYSLAYRIALEFDSPIPETISYTASRLAEGQMEETLLSDNFFLPFSSYIKIIYKKTAVLFECSMGIGTLLSDNTMFDLLSKFGRLLGYSFQITDDILDYTGDPVAMGKPALGDLNERKVTMPIIAARNYSGNKCDKIKNLWDLPNNMDKIYSWMIKNKGIELAKTLCLDYIGKADSLLKDVNEGYEKELLIKIAKYSAVRGK